ncbi:MAG: TrmB family transcriptional regulator [Candidatus Cloacimonadota bacterium]|nr:MAG: TrmB family transcriptional regulator [Candidatus Cloacimonadota bacterium]
MKNNITQEYLIQIGLNSYEAKAYLGLLRRRSFTAPELWKITKIPRSRVYDILSSLNEKGFVSILPGKPRRFCALDPLIALKNLQVSVEREISAKKEHLDSVTLELQSLLIPLYKKGQKVRNPIEYIEILNDPGQIGKRFKELQLSCKKEMMAFVKPPYVISQKENLPTEKKVLKKDIAIRAVYEEENSDEFRTYLKLGIEEGEKARVVKTIPIKFVLFDMKKVIYALEDPDLGNGRTFTYFIVEHKELAKLFKAAFEYYWKTGSDPLKR